MLRAECVLPLPDGTDWIRWRPDAATAGTETFLGA